MPDNGRVLSLQSTVVYGYVGNKASVLPLQMNGIEVDPFHTCQFSNHAAYPTFPGRRAEATDLELVVRGLKDNGMLAQYSDVLFGYMGSQGVLDTAVSLVRELREQRDDVFFLCDPVMGDNGSLYVPASFVETYKTVLVPMADMITPNQTELE